MKSCLQSIEQNNRQEEWDLFRQAVTEAMEKNWKQELSTSTSIPEAPSHRHKENMNRIFREQVGGSFQPYPNENTCQGSDSETPLPR